MDKNNMKSSIVENVFKWQCPTNRINVKQKFSKRIECIANLPSISLRRHSHLCVLSERWCCSEYQAQSMHRRIENLSLRKISNSSAVLIRDIERCLMHPQFHSFMSFPQLLFFSPVNTSVYCDSCLDRKTFHHQINLPDIAKFFPNYIPAFFISSTFNMFF